MSLLAAIHTPDDLKRLAPEQLPALADELRQRILRTVSSNGGHLASNLGSVELTIGLLRLFNPPHDKIVWDVGHQAYAWKLLTGRQDRFHTLRTLDGVSGFPRRAESPYDAFVGGHAGTALSAALGMAAARDLRGGDESVIAVIGDASITNGISFEALNNVQETTQRLIVILNDNEMSISENVGALSRHLGRLLASRRYNRLKARAEQTGHRLRMTRLRRIYHRIEQTLKSFWLNNTLFEEFGLRYIGPIDGHDLSALNSALTTAKEDKLPVIVHIATRKGLGYRPAEQKPSHWHGVGAFDPASNTPPAAKPGYSEVLGRTLVDLAQHDPRIVAITAAMTDGTGLGPFAKTYQNRFFDVGICEPHAAVFAAGLATEGFRPFFAVYSSFMQRAVDCAMHDVCLQNLPVVFCLDRAGIVGPDGPTHHGVFDIPMLRCLPNLALLQPADADELAAMVSAALTHDGPVVIRYPRTPPPTEPVAPGQPLVWGRAAVLREAEPDARPICFWTLGDYVPLAHAAADLLGAAGIAATVVNARFIKPIDTDLLFRQAASARLIVTLENGALAGGFGSAVQEALAAAGLIVPVHAFGWPDAFIQHGTVKELEAIHGLTPQAIASNIRNRLSTPA